VIAGCIQREGRGQGPEAAFGEAPEERVGFQVERGSFPISLRPSLGEPGDVKARISVVGNGVEGVGVCETDSSVSGGMSSDGELCSAWQVAELVQAIGFAVVGRVASAVERSALVGGGKVDAI
jgi:hypothetical protein